MLIFNIYSSQVGLLRIESVTSKTFKLPVATGNLKETTFSKDYPSFRKSYIGDLIPFGQSYFGPSFRPIVASCSLNRF